MSSHRSSSRPAAVPTGSVFTREDGSSLFLVLLLSVAMITVLGGIFAYISLGAKEQRRSDVRLESTYAAEYAFALAFDQLNTLIFQNSANLPNIAQTTAVTNLGTAPTTMFPLAKGYTWKSFITVPMDNETPVNTFSNFNPSMGVYKYMTVVEFSHTTSVNQPPVNQLFQQEWDYTIVPLFQYAIFYNSAMELFPGAAFNVGGRVHANGQIFTGTTASISFAGAVTSTSGIANRYMPADPRGQPNLNGPINYTSNPTISNTQNPPGTLGANLSDTNLNNDGARELIEMPNVWQQDDNTDTRLYNQAGLKVLRNSGTADITTPSGVTVQAGQTVLLTKDGTVIPASSNAQLYNYLASSGTGNVNAFRSTTINDYRENATVTAVDVVADQINQAYVAGGLPKTIPNQTTWPNNNTVPTNLRGTTIPAALRGKDFWNGVVYVSDVSNNNATGRRTGVQIRGSQLPNGSRSESPTAGLTVVSDNAAYILGDYNTGGTPPVNSGTNLGANPYASGYTVQPAAVIADAVTVLSSNWSTDGGNSNLSNRPAVNTTVNCALISGIVPTSNAAYSGGVENYIRLLEDWSGRRLTYYGSMINTYNSQQSTGRWQTTGNYYNAPARNWYFDTGFLDPTRLPPGTPLIRTLMRGRWASIEQN